MPEQSFISPTENATDPTKPTSSTTGNNTLSSGSGGKEHSQRHREVPYWVVALIAIISASIGAIGTYASAYRGYDLGKDIGRQEKGAELQPTIEALKNRRLPIAVDSTKEWQSTGLFVKKGENVVIRVVGGKWTSWRQQLPVELRASFPKDMDNTEIWINRARENDGSGGDLLCEQVTGAPEKCPISKYKESALVARIGDAKYGVGASCAFLSASDGVLQLRINDLLVGDNFGNLSVEVSIDPSVTNINSQHCGEPVE
ncbi:MAG: hypothetical protein IPP13_03310 [Kouleothrix sp.]|jgi:hypothetical protein|nr:hypothetical protein [Kouleothrix sp.]